MTMNNENPIITGQLTQEEQELILNALESRNDTDKEYISNLPSNNGVEINENPIYEPITETVNIGTNLNNGLSMQIPEPIDHRLAELLDVDVEDIINVPDNIVDINIRTEDIYRNAIEGYGIKSEDVKDLLPFIDKRRNGEDVSYNDLPLNIKKVISAECASVHNFSKDAKNVFTDLLLDGIIRDSGIDRIKIDMEEAIKDKFKFETICAEVSEETKNNFENILENKALEYTIEGKQDKADAIREVINSWKQSYRLVDFKNQLPKIKIKKIDFEKIYRICNEFNFKYENLRYFEIHDVNKLRPALGNIFPEYSQKVRDALVIAFCKYCINLKSSKVSDHTFMSYFILNTLQIITVKEPTGVLLDMKNSLKECLDILKNKYEE